MYGIIACVQVEELFAIRGLGAQRSLTSDGLRAVTSESGMLRIVDVDAICEVGELRRRGFHGQGVLLGVETGERRGVANENMGIFASETCCSGNSLRLDTFTKL
jgi:hypothetical protein